MSTIPETMKAALLVGRNQLEVREVPTPQPGLMEVLLKVESCACCSTDVALMDKPLQGQPPYGNFTPGHEYAGIVAALGEGVDEFKIGDRVAVEAHLGCMRCKNCRVGNYNTVHPIQDHIDFNEAALITNLGCVLYGFETIGGYVAGNQVVVIGPGPLGLISSQVAKALGAEKVFLIGTRASRLSKGAETGADRLINIHEENATEVILQETGGIGADLVVESSGASDAPMMAIKMAKPMGKILMLGMPHEPVLVDFQDLLLKNKSIHTVRGEGWSNVARAVSLLGSGKITLKPYVTHTFPLDEINAAFETFVKRIDGAVKVVVKSNA
jgi:L-iditol 2-dehydrogenase